jgi:hypothetical protein
MKRQFTILLSIFLIVSGSVSAFTTTPIQTQSQGDTLYVGGSGPGNYSKIQDAIDDASTGDTIYVYPGTYKESLTIEVDRLTLIGHDRNTTKIDSDNTAITIEASRCKISQFTISTYFSNYHGILINAKYPAGWVSDIKITNNRFIGCLAGVDIDVSFFIPYTVKFVTIAENIFINNMWGIISMGWFNNIYHNTLKSNYCGLYHRGMASTITQNYIDNCQSFGIKIGGTFNNVARNSIQHCDDGIYCGGFFSNIHHNNLYNNSRNAFLRSCFFNNRFFRNYWNESRVLPYPIKGEFHDFNLNEYIYYDFDFFPQQTPNMLLPATT